MKNLIILTIEVIFFHLFLTTKPFLDIVGFFLLLFLRHKINEDMCEAN